jgi:hypothetical protein
MAECPHEIHLTAEQKVRLAKLADQVGKPWPEVFDEALAAYPSLPSQQGVVEESFYDAATRLGFIGCVRGTPPDLSTNPMYMDGFGKRDS